ncbi:serine/threonine protein kinase [Bacillus sp. Marseille-P3661]|uniref:serine/threonine protein kinase n=1 Tax=Bacillus sp. Marseille-P3661 TaxID=1936234 RepID=UPI000C815F2D|nr:serine/threonine protein kinase [Bacillus sp. Marseille-P3661]
MNEWDVAKAALKHVVIKSNKNNLPVTVSIYTDQLQCIGTGTDAAVFRHKDAPKYAYKIFADDKLEKLAMEQKVYLKLKNLGSYFPQFFDAKSNYIVLSYEKGSTLFDCLIEGTHIPPNVLHAVDDARALVYEIGLNPRDIHLKNILMYEEKIKIVDVSEYMKLGDDRRWEYLKKAYYDYYHLIDGKKIPLWMLETVRKWYSQANSKTFNYDEFVNNTMKLFKIGNW